MSKIDKTAPGKKRVSQLAGMRAYCQWCLATLQMWIMCLKGLKPPIPDFYSIHWLNSGNKTHENTVTLNCETNKDSIKL